jgi:predicted RNase H-like nuclease
VNTFIGVDLGWYGKPSGLAAIGFENSHTLTLRNIARLESVDDILAWIQKEAGGATSIIAVDAPLVIRNQTGIRPAERLLNRDFRRFHAGCHAANLGRPFAQNVIAFSRRLTTLGFAHAASLKPREQGRYQIEVHPHAATVTLFGLERIVKYKRGTREARARGLRRLRKLIQSRLPELEPGLSARLPSVPRFGNLKPIEDQIDAVLCAYVACHFWFWGHRRNRTYGSAERGYIVVPEPDLPRPPRDPKK